MKSKKGFTLIELLVYTGVFMITAGVLTGILATSVRVRNRELASTEITQQLNFTLDTIRRIINQASLIESVYEGDTEGTACTSFCTLKLRNDQPGENADEIVYITSDAEGIYLTEGNNAMVTLTNEKVTVDYLKFTKYDFEGGHTTAGIDLSLTFDTDNPQYAVTRTIRSAVGRVTAATFDDNLLPGANNTYDVGQITGDAAWRDGVFSGSINIKEGSAPSASSSYGKLYVSSSNGELYYLDSVGTVMNMSSAVFAPHVSGVKDAAPNLAPNASFEFVDGATGDPYSWTEQSGSVSVSTGGAPGSAGNNLITLGSGAKNEIRSIYAIPVNQSISQLCGRISAQASSGALLNFGLVWTGGATAESMFVQDKNTGGSWEDMSGCVSVPASATSAVITIYNDSGSTSVLADDVWVGTSYTQVTGTNLTVTMPSDSANTYLKVVSEADGTDGDQGRFTIDPTNNYLMLQTGTSDGGVTDTVKIHIGAGDSALVINSAGDVSGTHGTYHISSDVRGKKDIRTIDNALEKVLGLRGVYYNWINKEDKSLQMGLIAQEVELVVPEVVFTGNDEAKTKAVYYDRLVGLLIEAMREQQAEIDSLEARIEALENGVVVPKKETETEKSNFWGRILRGN